MVSSTDRMKHAEHCGCGSIPTLNHTGLLKEAFWCNSRCLSSAENASADSSDEKYPCLSPQPRIVLTTRPIIWRTLFSRSGLPRAPRKYLETTTLVANCDHAVGISTSRCSKTVLPFSSWMTALRVLHSTSSKGSTPGVV